MTAELRKKYEEEHACAPQLSHYAIWLESQLEKEREFGEELIQHLQESVEYDKQATLEDAVANYQAVLEHWIEKGKSDEIFIPKINQDES